jgi:mono/diheme cytochrome c family protein
MAVMAAAWAGLMTPSAGALEPWVAPAAAAAVVPPAAGGADAVKKGRGIYDDRCSDCHGRRGRGDGSGGLDLERRPTDLTAAAVAAQSDGALFWKLTEGRRPMPGYGKKLSEEERWQVIAYIRSLGPKQKQPPSGRK